MRDPKVQTVRFNFHPEYCVGCYACVTACVDEHNNDIDSMPPLRCIARLEEHRGRNAHLTWYSIACIHCPTHECMDVCPKHCFAFDAATGTIQLDNTHCIGCRVCAKACRYHGILFDTQAKAQKCDGCFNRLKEGRLPRCVEACPRFAITIDDRPSLRNTNLAALADTLQSKQLLI